MFGFDPYASRPYSTISSLYSRTLSAVSTSAVSITTIIYRLYKQTLSAVSTSTVTIFKAISKFMTDVVSETAVIIAFASHFITMIASSITVVSIQRNIGKYLTIGVNSAIIISKFLTKTIALTSSVIASLNAGVISFSKYARNKVIYVRDSLRELSSVKFKTITGPLRQFRSMTVAKFRTLFAQKGPEV
jgi:hypothetical protein